jgi:hypothetical protein
LAAPATLNQSMASLNLSTYSEATGIATNVVTTHAQGKKPQVTSAQHNTGGHHRIEIPRTTMMSAASQSSIPPHMRAHATSVKNTTSQASIPQQWQSDSVGLEAPNMPRNSVPPHMRLNSPVAMGSSTHQARPPPHLRGIQGSKGPGSTSTSVTNASDTLQSAAPMKAMEWRPQHLKTNKAPAHARSLSSTKSVLSSGSRDGIESLSTTSRAPEGNGDRTAAGPVERRYNAYGPGGEVSMRTTGRPQSETTAVVSGARTKTAQGARDRRRPDKHGFARPVRFPFSNLNPGQC